MRTGESNNAGEQVIDPSSSPYTKLKQLIQDYCIYPEESTIKVMPYQSEQVKEPAACSNAHRIIPIIVLSYSLELLSSADLVSDIYIMSSLAYSGLIA